jgi:hypothetical protein
MRFVSGTTDKRRGIGDRPQTLNLLHWYQSRWLSSIVGVVDLLRTLPFIMRAHPRVQNMLAAGILGFRFAPPQGRSSRGSEGI